MSRKYLADYSMVIDGQHIEKKAASQIKIYPDHLLRTFLKDVVEHLYFLEDINCLILEYAASELHSYEFTPLFDDNFNPEAWEIRWQKNQDLLILAPKEKNKKEGASNCIGICFDCSVQYKSEQRILKHFDIPARQIGSFRVAKDLFRIFIIVAPNEAEIRNLATLLPQNFEKYLDAKRQRITKLLGDCHFETNLADFNKAFRWALLSMDQLIMKQPAFNKKMTGIFAGLPWFCDYWGRDTFISLPGAALVTAQLEPAKEILLSFAQFQSTNADNSDFGRIPNQITTENVIYNTADATPWFVRELWEYYLYSGDSDILKNLYPVVKRTVDGTLKYHMDQNYFLTHAEAETWMDAQGADGPWSPRGNRAVEIQALWFQQLLAAANIANLVGEDHIADEWRQIARQLQQNFQRKFWNDKRLALYDHLNSSDEPDTKIRPNQILAVTVPEQPILNPERELMVVKEVATKLAYPYGVASLWQHDPDFHPYHVHPPFYPKDAAYHNGTVWLWLSGPVISSFMKYGYEDLAFEMLTSETTQILQWGGVGTLSELLNAVPFPGQSLPAPSGTVTQAWSLAEYLRNIYQDLIGIKPDVPNQKIILEPHLPAMINSLTCRIPLGQANLHLYMQQESQSFNISLNYLEGNHDWTIEIRYSTTPGEKIIFSFPIQMEQEKKVRIELNEPISLTIDDKPAGFRLERLQIPKELFNYISFAIPQIDRNLKCIKHFSNN
ncbi:MAG: GH116 family glycosyl hydrolase [candidate division KSB1 bacterium]|nr:GH116 family glycosyl hydrolase [candidate division KSB1 bacterium]